MEATVFAKKKNGQLKSSCDHSETPGEETILAKMAREEPIIRRMRELDVRRKGETPRENRIYKKRRAEKRKEPWERRNSGGQTPDSKSRSCSHLHRPGPFQIQLIPILMRPARQGGVHLGRKKVAKTKEDGRRHSGAL